MIEWFSNYVTDAIYDANSQKYYTQIKFFYDEHMLLNHEM